MGSRTKAGAFIEFYPELSLMSAIQPVAVNPPVLPPEPAQRPIEDPLLAYLRSLSRRPGGSKELVMRLGTGGIQ